MPLKAPHSQCDRNHIADAVLWVAHIYIFLFQIVLLAASTSLHS